MQAKIKVLHIIKSLGRGGAEMLLQETLKQHDKEKFDFHYIYFLPWKNQMVQGLVQAGGTVKNFPAGNNIKIALQTGKIIKYIRSNKIQLLHCHLPWAGFVGRFIHMLTGIPVIYSEHNKQERYHGITKAINKLTFNKQTRVIAVSNDVAESIKKMIHPTVPVQTILNGVNMEHFVRDTALGLQVRQQQNIDPNCIVLGTIAVFRFQKRLKEWIDLFKIMVEKFPGIRGIVVGDGPLKAELLSYLKEQGMEEKIVFPGLQTDVLPWLSAMDVFMMTSEFEGLPVALLEAMSMQCAVVGTDAGGIKEVLRNNIDGFMVPVSEWKELEKPLTYLLENPLEIKVYGRRARQRVEEAFSLKVMVKEIEELYGVIGNRESAIGNR
ncbi:MAG: glycosyltransferase [Ferruginibacter sp.]